MSDESAGVEELELEGADGLWEVSSSGPTRYLFDADACPPACMRGPGPGTRSRGVTDNLWVPVIEVRSLAADGTVTPGVIRVGERPVWDLDAVDEVVWWIQRRVTAIRPLSRDELLVAREPTHRDEEPA